MEIHWVKIIVAIFLAVLGWGVGHRLNSQREIRAKRRELITAYLIDVYRKLDKFALFIVKKRPGTQEIADDINSAFVDIQLFGSQPQIELAIEIAESMASGNVNVEVLKSLILNLRSSLRSELELSEVNKPIAYLGMTYREGSDTSNN